MSQGGQPSSEDTWEQDIESRVAGTCYSQRWLGRRSLSFKGSRLMVALKGAPGKAKWELGAGILSSGCEQRCHTARRLGSCFLVTVRNVRTESKL